LETDYLAEKIEIEIRYGSVFSKYNDFQPPDDRILFNYSWTWGLNPDTNTPDKLDIMYTPADSTGAHITEIGDFEFDTRYIHEVTQSEIDGTDGTSYIYILIVNSKDGALNYGDHYYFINNGWTLVIRQNDTVFLEPGWFLELFVYKLMGT